MLVDETQNANLFYSFVKCERNPADDPVMIWLIGGPGCSGFGKLINGFGKLKISPFKFDPMVEMNRIFIFCEFVL